MKKNHFGFTIIELLIVIIIICVLAAIAVPMYSNYNSKTKIITEIQKIKIIKSDISEAISMTGITSGEIHIHSSNILTPIGVNVTDAGVITIAGEGTEIPDGGEIKSTPSILTGVIEWDCTSTGIERSQLPNICTPVDVSDSQSANYSGMYNNDLEKMKLCVAYTKDGLDLPSYCKF